MTVYVGSECDASMPNGTQARENHVGSSDRQADNSFISGEDENFTVNGNGSTTGIYEAKLTQDKPAAATLMVFDVSGKLVVSRQMTGEKRQASRLQGSRIGCVCREGNLREWGAYKENLSKVT